MYCGILTFCYAKRQCNLPKAEKLQGRVTQVSFYCSDTFINLIQKSTFLLLKWSDLCSSGPSNSRKVQQPTWGMGEQWQRESLERTVRFALYLCLPRRWEHCMSLTRAWNHIQGLHSALQGTTDLCSTSQWLRQFYILCQVS